MATSSLKRAKRVRFSISAKPRSEVYIAGTFNGWNPKKHKLRFVKGVYSGSILVPPGRHQYKFIIDGVWCVDPECPDWAPNGLGNLSSVVDVA